MTTAVHVTLKGHPANPACFHQRVEANLQRAPDGALVLTYRIHGLNLDLRVPSPHAPAPADALWKTTCFELFLGATKGTAYREFNFSPSGQWAAYDFSDTRLRLPHEITLPQAPQLDFARSEDLLSMEVRLPHSGQFHVQNIPESTSLRLALSVILEAEGGHLGYWALAHPPGKPDFHHPHSFLLAVDGRGIHAQPQFS